MCLGCLFKAKFQAYYLKCPKKTKNAMMSRKKIKNFTFLNLFCAILEFVDVEILVFGVYKNPLLLREVHMIDRTMLTMFLDRRNSE